MKKPPQEQSERRETETAAWDENWLQAERELREVTERDEAEAVVWRNTAIRQGRDVHRVTVRPERRSEYKQEGETK